MIRPSVALRLRSRRHGRLLGYAAAVVLVVVASLVQLALRPMLPSDQTLLFYPVVYGAARLAGRGPGLTATVLSAVSITYFFPPSYSFAIYDPADQLDLAIFATLSFVLVVNVANLDVARDAALDASARLDEQRAVLEAVIEHAPMGLLFATTDDVVRYENESFRNIGDGGTTHVEKLSDLAARRGLRWKDGRPVSQDEWRAVLERASESLVEFEGQWVTPSGTTAWLNNRFTPVRSPGKDGHPVGIVAIVRDATAEHEITQLREEVTSIIAHDLRNPIATISMSLYQALHERGRFRRFVRVPRSAIERISRSAKRLDGMVGELLDAARVDQGLRIERDTVDMRELVAELVEDLRPSLRGHDVRLDAPDHAITACVDRLRISQVFTNLLDNASKYSPPEAPIRTELRPSDGGVEVSVVDQGEGIAPEDVHRLFDRFFQARKARARAGGLGLGLYISKGIVDAHGGRLSVESAPGAGSTFHVWLPAHAPPGSAA